MMMNNKKYSSLGVFLIIVLAGGNSLAAAIDARAGNNAHGSEMRGKSSDADSAGSRHPDYPTGWYYYGNPSDELYDDYAYSEDDGRVNAAASSPVHIEQRTRQKVQSSDSGYWNYCPVSKGYYPYVRDCPVQWQKVSMQPLGQKPGHWYYCKDPAGYYPYVRTCNSDWQKIIPY